MHTVTVYFCKLDKSLGYNNFFEKQCDAIKVFTSSIEKYFLMIFMAYKWEFAFFTDFSTCPFQFRFESKFIPSILM
jgi:hypothetical protein